METNEDAPAVGTARAAVADLRLMGMQGLCLDPTKDGAGSQVAFDDLQQV